MTLIGPGDIDKKKFTTTRFREGYDQDEVDSFLDQVQADYATALKLASAPRPMAGQDAPTQVLAPVPASVSSAELLIKAAQDSAAKLVAQAEAAAAQATSQAQAQAVKMVDDAHVAAAQATAQAQVTALKIVDDANAAAKAAADAASSEAAKVVAALEQRKSDLEAQVAALTATHQDVTGRLGSALAQLGG